MDYQYELTHNDKYRRFAFGEVKSQDRILDYQVDAEGSFVCLLGKDGPCVYSVQQAILNHGEAAGAQHRAVGFAAKNPGVLVASEFGVQVDNPKQNEKDFDCSKFLVVAGREGQLEVKNYLSSKRLYSVNFKEMLLLKHPQLAQLQGAFEQVQFVDNYLIGFN